MLWQRMWFVIKCVSVPTFKNGTPFNYLWHIRNLVILYHCNQQVILIACSTLCACVRAYVCVKERKEHAHTYTYPCVLLLLHLIQVKECIAQPHQCWSLWLSGYQTPTNQTTNIVSNNQYCHSTKNYASMFNFGPHTHTHTYYVEAKSTVKFLHVFNGTV